MGEGMGGDEAWERAWAMKLFKIFQTLEIFRIYKIFKTMQIFKIFNLQDLADLQDREHIQDLCLRVLGHTVLAFTADFKCAVWF